ncbi:MAG: MYXO-CTERM sorting domain-containing protein [Acidobacteriota bacterium]
MLKIGKGSVLSILLALAGTAAADPVLHVGTPALDPPTITALGVYLPITGDDNFNATVTLRYRIAGTAEWHDALPLQHVHAEVVTGFVVTPTFAGSIFDLQPATSYDVELHAIDPDGPVDTTLTLTGQTRPVPAADPLHPHAVAVSDAASLAAALAAAQPGDVITLASGTYTGPFSFTASGTADDPIVIRGASQDGAIVDGGGCTGCNILEAYGSFIHVEDLTIQDGTRALRFQGMGAQANVVRRVHITNVTLAIGSNPDQRDFYIADNVIEGRLVWPCVYTSDDPACNAGGQHGLHANDDGIHVEGTGHVIAHNRISGFGDAMKTEQDGAVSIDFYGNDVLWTYDNAIELDGSLRNTRALRNRFTNTFATLSFQPIFGGPAYAIRNVLVNVADEQFKLHARGTDPTVGAVILHNTVVRATRAVQCSSADSPLYFTAENNLYVGPTTIGDGHAVRWDLPSVATDTMDYDGFYPDGQFELGYGTGGTTYASFMELVAGGRWEGHATLVDANVLGGMVGPADWTVALAPSTPQLATASSALDRGAVLAQIDDGYTGAAPDLGALEAGCAAPIYGPRPAGMDETNEPVGCPPATSSGGDDAATEPPGARSAGGCGCRAEPGGAAWLVAVVAGWLAFRRRR